MNIRKLLKWTFSVTLIAILLSGYSRIDAQPQSGDWTVQTDFGEFVFTVNPDGTLITKLIITFSSFTCGSVTQSGTMIFSTSPGWPISNNQFTIDIWINFPNISMTITGTFIETGYQASGTWSVNVSGTICAGDWGGIVPVELTSFTAIIYGENIHLNWTTATEVNNLGFEIERRFVSKNLQGDWSSIGFVEGNGTTTEIQNYQFTDDISSNSANSLAYRLKQIDFDGSFEYSDEVMVDNPAPIDYALQQNYPNPFNPTTTISYSSPLKSQVSLVVYNTLGESITQLINEEKEAGKYSVEFNASGLPSGIYFYKLQAGSFVENKKMVLIK
jgi:hypothetical protein